MNSEEEVTQILKESYYKNLIKYLKEHVKKKFEGFDLFLLHFDKKVGPVLACKKNTGRHTDGDVAIADQIKVPISGVQDQEWNKLPKELRDKIINVFDATTKETEIETILRMPGKGILQKKNIMAFFRYFEVSSSETRGGKEMMMLVFISKEMLEPDMMNKVREFFREKLALYFNLFKNNHQEINKKPIKEFIKNVLVKAETTPREKMIVKEYFEL